MCGILLGSYQATQEVCHRGGAGYRDDPGTLAGAETYVPMLECMQCDERDKQSA